MKYGFIARALVVIGLLVVLGACSPASDNEPPPGLRTEIGDGSWIAGEEIQAGLWEPIDDIRMRTGCVWFVTPKSGAPKVSPSGIIYASVVAELRNGDSFTTYACGKWHLI